VTSAEILYGKFASFTVGSIEIWGLGAGQQILGENSKQVAVTTAKEISSSSLAYAH
jgi:hypothetical protein